MRGDLNKQSHLFSYFSPESRVREDHPLRTIKAYADQALGRLSEQLGEMYSDTGRPSIPPERLLKAKLLIALYTVRSERLFCEMLDYNLLFRWFLDMDVEEASFDASTFSKNLERLLQARMADEFFAAVVKLCREQQLLSDEHFSVDGTLIEAWASHKSFRPKDGGNDGGDGNNFHGQARRNDTHASTTDPQAKLYRKGPGKEARLSFGAQVLMENRNGLCVEVAVTDALVPESDVALDLIRTQKRKKRPIKSVGADKGYHNKKFVKGLKRNHIQPHVACINGRRVDGLDGRTTHSRGYQISQTVRKRIEQIMGWTKTIGGMRKTRHKGVARTDAAMKFVCTAYNLLRLSRLQPLTAELRPA
jgi:transposase